MKNAEQNAYPFHWQDRRVPEDKVNQDGLTKREYFASMAMQGLIAQMDRYQDSEFTDNIATLASDAVAIADELLKQLEQ